jgi:hypothetical protein
VAAPVRAHHRRCVAPEAHKQRVQSRLGPIKAIVLCLPEELLGMRQTAIGRLQLCEQQYSARTPERRKPINHRFQRGSCLAAVELAIDRMPHEAHQRDAPRAHLVVF